MDQANPMVALLALCARAVLPHHLHERLHTLVRAVPDWKRLPPFAEAHGMVPLLVHHLQTAAIPLPPEAKLALQSFYVQHAHAAQVRSQALADLHDRFAHEGIAVLVLKGAALAHLVYPQPQLRPMRDIDLLVRAADAHRAQALTAGADFTLPPGPDAQMPPMHHHLAPVSRHRQGFSVSVEIHHALLLTTPGRPALTYDDLAPAAQRFSLNGRAACALSREDLLWHVYQHAFGEPLTGQAVRLIWIADLVSMVEQWHAELDWEALRQRYPALLRALPLLHALTPWSPAVGARLAPPPPQLRPMLEYQGWPRYTLAQQRGKGLRRIVADTLFPSRWWLLTTHGEDLSRTGFARAWREHMRRLRPELQRVAHLHLRHHAGRLRPRGRSTPAPAEPRLSWTRPAPTPAGQAYTHALLQLIHSAVHELILVSPFPHSVLDAAGRQALASAILGALYRGVAVTIVAAEQQALGEPQRALLAEIQRGAVEHAKPLHLYAPAGGAHGLLRQTLVLADQCRIFLGSSAVENDVAGVPLELGVLLGPSAAYDLRQTLLDLVRCGTVGAEDRIAQHPGKLDD